MSELVGLRRLLPGCSSSFTAASGAETSYRTSCFAGRMGPRAPKEFAALRIPRRGARTLACRVGTHADAWSALISPGQSRPQQRAQSIPQNLHADADQDEGRQPYDHVHGRIAQRFGDPLGEAITQINRKRDRNGADHQARYHRPAPLGGLGVVGSHGDRYRDGTWANRQRERQRIERLPHVVRLVAWLLGIRSRAIVIGIPQQRPAGRDHYQPPAHLHHRERDPKKPSMCVPMKIDASIKMRPLMAMLRESFARPSSDTPRVMIRKMGALPSGLTIGNSAPTTSNVLAIN